MQYHRVVVNIPVWLVGDQGCENPAGLIVDTLAGGFVAGGVDYVNIEVVDGEAFLACPTPGTTS